MAASSVAEAAAAARPQPTPRPPLVYYILIGLSIMTLSTILFGPISQSLSARGTDISTHLFEATTGEYPLKYGSEAQLSSLIDRFETQVHKLEVITQYCSTTIAEVDKRPLRDTSQVDKEIITAILVFFVLIIKLVGLVTLYDALERISQRHSTRAIALGIIGVNIAAFWSLSGLGRTMGGSGEATWDRVMLLCLISLDVGCILGSVISLKAIAD
ncbi:hypothetical protein OIDMADRAFT_182953 [Oidiodendron maius Zn]|uniref:Uncharacterized protein n=1 Tax=Oidiodendron maius (strain Zn) TaxID=913774 RepID=A0A0C3CCZ2_OIDMZ|nr:hypothetical protein OIDMADRAFT_182953 [Oidiodendron maius Zn]